MNRWGTVLYGGCVTDTDMCASINDGLVIKILSNEWRRKLLLGNS